MRIFGSMAWVRPRIFQPSILSSAHQTRLSMLSYSSAFHKYLNSRPRTNIWSNRILESSISRNVSKCIQNNLYTCSSKHEKSSDIGKASTKSEYENPDFDSVSQLTTAQKIVEKFPSYARPYLKLMRLDRPIGEIYSLIQIEYL